MLPFLVTAQTSQKEIIRKLNAAVSNINTMQCDFVQTKHMKMLNEKLVSSGKMAYKQSDKLKWEYTSPYSYIFILNGTKIYLNKGSRNDEIDVRQNKLFQEIAKIMMNSVIGKCLTDTKEFKVSIQQTSSEWIATVLPQKKDLKQMFPKILLYFNKTNSIISKVVMYEKNGDYTIIQLKNIRLNKAISANEFSL